MKQSITLAEHVFIAGITGGGKGNLTENYLSQFPKVIKLDTKGEALDRIQDGVNPWRQVHPKELVIVEKLSDVMKVEEPYVIYCPTFEELNADAFNDFFMWVYFNKNKSGTVTWVDEVMEVSPSAHQIPTYYKALMTKGRSRRTPVWSLTQRPSDINNIIFSQSTHLYSFDLPLINDRKKVAECTGAKEFLEMPTGYNFWYFRRGWRNAVKGIFEH